MTDCVVIANIDTSVEERLSTSDQTAKTCCRRQYVHYMNKKLYYNEFFSQLRIGNRYWEPRYEYGKRQLTLCEIPSFDASFLAAYLEKQGITTYYINYYNGMIDEFVNILNKGCRFVVLSLGAMFNSIPIVKFVRAVKRTHPEVKIIVSGSYIYNKRATSDDNEYIKTMQLIGADFYITQFPGERQIEYIIKTVLNKKSGGNEKFEGLQYTEMDVDWDYHYVLGEAPVMYLKTSKGCPAKCSFCNFPIKNKNLLYSDLAVVNRQLNSLSARNTKSIIFLDDTLNIPNRRFDEICKLIIKNNYNFTWYCYCRLKELTEESVRLMAESRCAGVFVGIESADDKILKAMNKGASLKDYDRGLQLLYKHGIPTFAFLLVGFPGETKETINLTINYLNNAPIKYFTANLWYADVSTPIYEEQETYGLKGKHFAWKHMTMDSLEAAMMTDKIMMEVNSAIWVPNENFGFQGIPYLFGKGYSEADVSTILKDTKKLVEANITGEIRNFQKYVDRISNVLNKNAKGK